MLFAIGVGLLSAAATGALAPSLLVASASVFGGIYSFRFNHPALFALTYAPWVLLAWHAPRQCQRRFRQRAAAAIGLAMSTALLLVAATPKEAAVMLVGVHACRRAHGVVVAYLVGRRRCSIVLGDRRGHGGLPRDHAALVHVLRDLAKSFTVYDKPYAILAGRSEAVGSSSAIDPRPRRTRTPSARSCAVDGGRDRTETPMPVAYACAAAALRRLD